MGKEIFEWLSGAGVASCGIGDDASFGRRNSFGDVFLGVLGDVFLGVPGEDLSLADLIRRLLGGRGEMGGLGERLFGLSSVTSGGGVLDAGPSVGLCSSVSCVSCLLGVSGDLANPLLTARGVTTAEGDVT